MSEIITNCSTLAPKEVPHSSKPICAGLLSIILPDSRSYILQNNTPTQYLPYPPPYPSLTTLTNPPPPPSLQPLNLPYPSPTLSNPP